LEAFLEASLLVVVFLGFSARLASRAALEAETILKKCSGRWWCGKVSSSVKKRLAAKRWGVPALID
jgi:hypothetical protein